MLERLGRVDRGLGRLVREVQGRMEDLWTFLMMWLFERIWCVVRRCCVVE